MASTDPLVSTQWLADNLSNPHVRVVDASFKMPGVTPLPKEDYERAHIPGAAFFDVDAISDHASPLPHMYPDADQFGRDVGELGIGNEDTVVLYDAGGWVAAPRAWWMFLSFGHDKVRILDGGLKKWIAEDRTVQGGYITVKPKTFKAVFDASRIRSREQMIANIASNAEQVIDARAQDRYEGTVAEPRPGLRAGHIPGSRNLPYNKLIAADGTMKPLEELRAAFAGAGVDVARPIATTCGSGVSAAVLTLALYRLGVANPALYDGSWSEWGVPDGPAIETGPAASR